MHQLSIVVLGAEPLPFSASPVLAFSLRLAERCEEQTAATHFQGIALSCQIRIEPSGRRYGAEECERLRDLLGDRGRWPQTMRGLLWTHADVVVPPFTGSTVVELQVPCTYDFNVGAARYFHALRDGEVPLIILFSGSTFSRSADGGLQVGRLPWELEATYRLPVRAWKEMMDHYYPGGAWLCLRKEILERLLRFKSRKALPTIEDALGRLLETAGEGVRR